MSIVSDSYEQFTKQVFESLVNVKVHKQHTYTGRISQRKIKVDVSFNFKIAEGADVLFLVECKCYKNNVSVDDVEEFHSKIDDIGAHKGIMVTTIGYQKGAIKTARGRKIALALLTTDKQPGELHYVVNYDCSGTTTSENQSVWQGNLLGPQDNYNGGYRFESIERFLSLLCIDAAEEERQRLMVTYEREHGTK